MFSWTCARWPVQLAPPWGNGSETTQRACSGRGTHRSRACPATASRGCGASVPMSSGSAPMSDGSAPMCRSTEADLAMRYAEQHDRTVRANRRPDALRPAASAGACSTGVPVPRKSVHSGPPRRILDVIRTEILRSGHPEAHYSRGLLRRRPAREGTLRVESKRPQKSARSRGHTWCADSFS